MIHYTYIVQIIINHLSAVASESHLGKAVRLLCRDLEEIFEFAVLVYFCFVFEVVEQRDGGFFQFVVFVFDVVEHDLFLTLGSGTSSAHSKHCQRHNGPEG